MMDLSIEIFTHYSDEPRNESSSNHCHPNASALTYRSSTGYTNRRRSVTGTVFQKSPFYRVSRNRRMSKTSPRQEPSKSKWYCWRRATMEEKVELLGDQRTSPRKKQQETDECQESVTGQTNFNARVRTVEGLKQAELALTAFLGTRNDAV